ncbi:SAM-dependent methyltransferase [Micromonosporaceae bacterium B7E4]
MPQEHFDRLYAENPDPWDFATSWYERRKYALTVASLPKRRYRSGFEVGCSVGELTRLLAPRCEKLLAVDCAALAVSRARGAVADLAHVKVGHASVPDYLPDDSYDLIVASEVLYYFSADDLQRLLDGLLARLEPGGDIIAAHLRAGDLRHGYDGHNVHSRLASHPALTRIVRHEDEGFVLDVLRHRDISGPK